MQEAAGIHDRVGGIDSLARAQAQALERLDELGVDAGIAPEHVVDPARLAQQLREVAAKRVARMGLVRLVVAARALQTRPVAVPGLHLPVPRLDVEGVGRAAGRAQHRDGAGMVEAGQVEEVAVLAEAELAVARARDQTGAQEDGDGVLSHRVEELSAPDREHARSLAVKRAARRSRAGHLLRLRARRRASATAGGTANQGGSAARLRDLRRRLADFPQTYASRDTGPGLARILL